MLIPSAPLTQLHASSYQVALAWEEKENHKLPIPISHEDRIFGHAHRTYLYVEFAAKQL